MPKATELMFSQGGGSAPFTITLAPEQDIELESVACEWDGTGAGASFLACLSVFSQDDVLIGRVFPSQRLAAGDEAVVTYAPF